jgi:hypothetical protein
MNNLRSIMINTANSDESRLFILKILMHRPTSFAPYSHLFIRPILTLATDMHATNTTNHHRGFHYILRDCCRLLEHWWYPSLDGPPGSNSTSTGIEDCRNFMSHLIQNCSHENTQILKSNLAHIRTLCELYSNNDISGGVNGVVDPCDIWHMFICRGKGQDAPWLTKLLEMETDTSISSSSSSSSSAQVITWRDRMHRVSLHLMSICVKNKYPLQSTKVRKEIPLTEKELYIHKKFGLASMLEHKSKNIRNAASIVIGMILYRARTSKGTIPPLSPAGQLLVSTMSTLKKVLNGTSTNKSSSGSGKIDVLRCISLYLTIIENICKGGNYPYILNDTIIETIFIKMNLLNGKERSKCLELINLYIQHTSRNDQYVKQRDTTINRQSVWVRMRPHLLVRHDIIERYHVLTQIEIIRTIEIMMTSTTSSSHENSFLIPDDDVLLLLHPSNKHSLTYNMTNHDDVTVRKEFYSFMTRIYSTTDYNENINGLIHLILVSGLSDTSKKVRYMIKEFWDTGKRGSISISTVAPNKSTIKPMVNSIKVRLQKLLSNTIYLGKMEESSSFTTPSKDVGGCGLFHSTSEDRWLEYASFLTISLTERTADYNRYLPGCEDKLQDCEFVEVNVHASTELLTMQPKYSSLISQISHYAAASSQFGGDSNGGGSQYSFSQLVSQAHDNDDNSGSVRGVGYVLATQSSSQLRFLATQAGGGQSLAFEHGLQDRMMMSMNPDAFSNNSSSSSSRDGASSSRKRGHSSMSSYSDFASLAPSSMALVGGGSFSQVGQPNMKRARFSQQLPDVPSFTDTTTSSSTSTQQLSYTSMNRFSKNTTRNPNKRSYSSTQNDLPSSSSSSSITKSNKSAKTLSTSNFFLQNYELNERAKIAAKRRERNIRRRKVTVYRTYRDGELPDVQIKLSDVMCPLLALCTYDNTIAKEWMVSLFSEVVSMNDDGGDEDDEDDSLMGDDSTNYPLNYILADCVSNLLLQSSPYLEERDVTTKTNSMNTPLKLNRALTVASNNLEIAGRGRNTAVTSTLLQFYLDIIKKERNPNPSCIDEGRGTFTAIATSRIQGIALAASQSSNYHLGALVLEEILRAIQMDSPVSSLSQTDGGRSDTARTIYILAKQCLTYLYTLSKEMDVVRSLSVPADEDDNDDIESKLKNAIDAERSGDRKHALRLYQMLQKELDEKKESAMEEEEETNETKKRNHILYQVNKGMIDCSKALQEWDIIEELVITPNNNKGNFLSLWMDDDNNKCNSFSLLNKHDIRLTNISSFVQYSLHHDGSNNIQNVNTLLDFFENALDDHDSSSSSPRSSLISPNNDDSIFSPSPGGDSSSSGGGSGSGGSGGSGSGRRNFILEHFSIEVALCFMIKRKYDRALPILSYALNNISKKWNDLHPLAKAERHSLLEKVPMLETLQHTMDARTTINSFKTQFRNSNKHRDDGMNANIKTIKRSLLYNIQKIVTSWNNCQLSIEHDTPIIWEQLRSTRVYCLNILEESFHSLVNHISKATGNQSNRLMKLVTYGEQKLSLSNAEGMMHSSCYDIANLYLSNLQNMNLVINTNECARIYFRNCFQYSMSSVASNSLEKSNERQLQKQQKRLSTIINMTDDFYNPEEEEDDDDDEKDEVVTKIDPEIVKINFLRGDMLHASSLFWSTSNNRAEIDRTLSTYEYAHSIMQRTKDQSIFWEPLLKYAMFCSKLLSSIHSKNVKGGRENLVVKIITLSLRALHLYNGSSNRNTKYSDSDSIGNATTPSTWFPRVLSLLRPWVGCDAVVDAFDQGTKGLPSYLLLKWNSQILSLCGGHQYENITVIIIKNILQPMMLMYPDAIYYNFIVMYEQLDNVSQLLLSPLKELISKSPKGKALNSFSSAIDATLLPQMKCLDGLTDLIKMFPKDNNSSNSKNKKGSSSTTSNIIEINKWKEKRLVYTNNLLNDLFGREKRNLGKMVGSYSKIFTKKYKPTLTTKIMKVIHSSSDLLKLKTSLRNIFSADIEKDFPSNKPKINTSVCTEWFSSYDPADICEDEEDEYDSDGDISISSSSNSFENEEHESNLHDTTIQLPGYYESMSCMNGPPRIEIIPRISSFGSNMLQLNSLRKPRRLTIIGSNYNEYYLLCKGGEDLRNVSL